MKRLPLAALALAAVLTAASCDFQSDVAVRVGGATAQASIQSLVPGVISQQRADVLKADVGSITKAASASIDCRKAIPGDASKIEKRLAKARCYKELAVVIRGTLDRGNLTGHPVIDALFAFFDAAASGLEEYCRAVQCGGKNKAEAALATEQTPAAVPDDLDKQLEKTLKDAAEALKRELKRHR